MNLWKTEKIWAGETVAVLGGGASMSMEAAQQVRGKANVIAVNNQGIVHTDARGTVWPAAAPWADILYAADNIWWYHNQEEAAKFKGVRVSIEPTSHNAQVNPVQDVMVMGHGGPWGFDDRPDYIRSGFNSGYQAVHLAATLGAKRILLLGFDMHADKGDHWNGDHRWRPGFRSRYELFIRAFDQLATQLTFRNVDVVNCTQGSALDCFPIASIEEGLNGLSNVWRRPQGLAGTHAPGTGAARGGDSAPQGGAASQEGC